MDKEIEKLFKKFDIILENYELDKECGQLSIDSICHLFPTEIMDLKQYIEDLQHQLKEKDKVIDEAIKLANDILVSGWDYVEKDNICIKLLEILERGKNVNSK